MNQHPYLRAYLAGIAVPTPLLLVAISLVFLGATGGFSLFRVLRGESDWGTGWLTGLGLIVFVLWFVGSIAYGIFAAVMVLMGKRFKYPVIGGRFERET